MSFPFPVLTPEEAASLIHHGDTVGFSGFTPAGAAKAIPLALAARAHTEHKANRPFQIGVLTGASTGDSLDRALASADAISFRAPFQSDRVLRSLINSGRVRFIELHISMLPQMVRYGALGRLHWAVIEAAGLTSSGGILLSTSVGASPTFANCADKILIELNCRHSPRLLGMHDIFEPEDPPTRRELPIYAVHDRAGAPMFVVPASKIAGVVYTNAEDECEDCQPPDSVTEKIGDNIAHFLAGELRAGRIPRSFLPLQSGFGDTANSVLASLGRNPEIPPFEMFTEVLQNAAVPLLESGRCKFASTCALTFGPRTADRFFSNLDFFRARVVMRPQEISNHPELIRRLGVISVNTALEVDLLGNVNSTHILGRNLVNGIGGSGDFTRNAYLSIFSCPSTRKNGAVSTIVPLATHVDHSEHSVQVLVTEYGVADLRGRDPQDRARLLIEKCAHPEYREPLMHYLELTRHGRTPHSLPLSFAMHLQLAESGDMRNFDRSAWHDINRRYHPLAMSASASR
jgi:succinate CoA transferase